MKKKIVLLTIQKWGNSLAVRIPATIARNAHFQAGTMVELTLQKGVVLVKTTGKQKLTLEERLALFDMEQHGGELMASKRIGKEKF